MDSSYEENDSSSQKLGRSNNSSNKRGGRTSTRAVKTQRTSTRSRKTANISVEVDTDTTFNNNSNLSVANQSKGASNKIFHSEKKRYSNNSSFIDAESASKSVPELHQSTYEETTTTSSSALELSSNYDHNDVCADPPTNSTLKTSNLQIPFENEEAEAVQEDSMYTNDRVNQDMYSEVNSYENNNSSSLVNNNSNDYEDNSYMNNYDSSNLHAENNDDDDNECNNNEVVVTNINQSYEEENDNEAVYNNEFDTEVLNNENQYNNDEESYIETQYNNNNNNNNNNNDDISGFNNNEEHFMNEEGYYNSEDAHYNDEEGGYYNNDEYLNDDGEVYLKNDGDNEYEERHDELLEEKLSCSNKRYDDYDEENSEDQQEQLMFKEDEDVTNEDKEEENENDIQKVSNEFAENEEEEEEEEKNEHINIEEDGYSKTEEDKLINSSSINKDDEMTANKEDDDDASRKASEDTNNKHLSGKIFVGGLGQNTTEETLKAYFEQFGTITHTHIILDKMTGKSRGFGFITFEEEQASQTCLQHKHFVDNIKVDVRAALNKEEAKHVYTQQDNTNRVFVGGLNENINEDQFRDFFQQFGPIKSSNLMYDKGNHKPRGFGFVIYENTQDADKSLGEHESLGPNCEAKKALPRPSYTRSKTNYQQNNNNNTNNNNNSNNMKQYQQIQRPVNQPHIPYPPMYHKNRPYESITPDYYGYGSSYAYSPMDPAYSQYPPYYEPNLYNQQYMQNYYPPPGPSSPYAYTSPNSYNHVYTPKYNHSTKGSDVYTRTEYMADRSRRNAIRSVPY